MALLIKVGLALTTYGTNDVLVWEAALAKIRSAGGIAVYQGKIALYWEGVLQHREVFNHPPFLVHSLRFLGVLADITGLPLRSLLRLTATLADVGSLILVWRIVTRVPGLHLSPAALFLYAASPVSILVSGFHGNTDPVMMFFVLLAFYFLEFRKSAWLSGAALGMAMNIKIVPLILLPALLLYFPDWRRRFSGMITAGVTFLVASLPYSLQDPLALVRSILSYDSLYGQWGWPRFAALLPEQLSWLNSLYIASGKYFVFGIIVVLSWWMNRRTAQISLFVQGGMIFFLFLFLTPGFGIQYLAWLAPWVVCLGLEATLLHNLFNGIFVFLVYNYWSQGFPWYFANSLATGSWGGHLILFEMLAWFSVGLVLMMYWGLWRQSASRTAAG